jgi:hypothetical protein
VDIAAVLGHTHVVASLGTNDVRVAEIKSARSFLLLVAFLETMRLRMACLLDIDGTDLSRTEALAMRAFALGREYEAKKAKLHEEFSARLRELVTSIRSDAMPGMPSCMPEQNLPDIYYQAPNRYLDERAGFARRPNGFSTAPGSRVKIVSPAAGKEPASPA